MKTLLLFAAITLPAFCFSQKAPIKYGDIPRDALEMKVYPADSSAEAVVLFDYGVSSIEYSQSQGFQLLFERIRRVKVLTEEGKRWADFTVYLYKDNDQAEKISAIKGVTVNLENGKEVESKLNNDGIFKDKYNKNLDQVKVTLPNVKVGSVFDITYKVTSDFLINFQDWDFQTTIPVAWSEYRAEIPEYFIYDKYMQGYLAATVNEHTTAAGAITLTSVSTSRGSGFGAPATGSRTQSDRIDYTLDKFRWVVSEAPAFKDEPYLTTRNDYISKINFELATIKLPGQPVKHVLGSWEEVNKRYSDSQDFYGEVTGNGFLRKIAEEATAGTTTTAEKIAAVVNYVKTSVVWNGETRITAEHNLRQVLSDKKGSSAEINLLIASMLEKLGINVRPVMLSTREHGFVREGTPAAQQFNYSVCLARWEDKQILIDATNPYLPLGFLPARCLNGRGMAVSPQGLEWITLSAPTKTRSVINADLELSPDGVLTGTIMLDYTGYEAADKRKDYLTDGDEKYIKDYLGTRQWQLSGSEFTNAKNIGENFKEKHKVVINEHISMAGDVMYMNPFIDGQWISNPFKSESRQYPVDFGNPFDEVYTMRLKLPPGMVVDELPAPKVFVMPGNVARYIFSSTVNGDLVSITSMLSVNRSLFVTEDYAGLREFCHQMVAKQTEQIVIKKK